MGNHEIITHSVRDPMAKIVCEVGNVRNHVQEEPTTSYKLTG